MKYEYNQYGFNVKYQVNTHKHVGKDYGKSKKKIEKLKKKNKYKICDTYHEWREYINSIIPDNDINKEKLIHWLKRRVHNAKSKLEVLKVVIIPIYILLLGLFLDYASDINSNKQYIIEETEESKYTICEQEDINRERIVYYVILLVGQEIVIIVFFIIIVLFSAILIHNCRDEIWFYNDFIAAIDDSISQKKTKSLY